MHAHKFILAAFAASLALTGVAGAQEPRPEGKLVAVAATVPAKATEKEVRRLVELSGMVEKELASLESLMTMLKEQSPQVPDEVWGEVRKELQKSLNREAVIQMFVPIFTRRFTAEEVKELTAFYESRLGRRLVEVTPFIESEAFAKGRERGVGVGARIQEILRSKGY